VRRSTVIALALTSAAVIVGVRAVAIARGSTPSSTQPPPAAGTSAAAPPAGPSSVDDLGVSHGWPRDADGATDAAVAAVRLTGPIARAGFITRSDMIRAFATEDFGPTLARESANQLAEMTAVFGESSVAPGDLVWSELPLTAQVVHADPNVAEIDVWSVLIVGVVDHGAPRQAWRTVTVSLAWEAGDWKVDGWGADAGPTPMLDGTAGVATTEEIDGVVSWPLAGGA
jgi:hypothetical protein